MIVQIRRTFALISHVRIRPLISAKIYLLEDGKKPTTEVIICESFQRIYITVQYHYYELVQLFVNCDIKPRYTKQFDWDMKEKKVHNNSRKHAGNIRH